MQETRSYITVFVSSRFDEFSQERVAIRKAVEDLPLTKTWLFEASPAAGETVFEIIRGKIAEADIFIVLLGEKFSEPVRFEYEVARALNKPTLVFIKETPTREEQQSEFIKQIPVKWATFRSPDDLAGLVRESITDLLIQAYRRFNIAPSDFKEPGYKQEVEVGVSKSKPDKSLCFVIMPIGKQGTREYKEFKAIFDSLIKPAVEIDNNGKPTGLRCERADQEIRTGNIPKDIIEKLASAEIVIADLTTRNPNVFYELGVRHSLKQKTIMIAQSIDDIPFDVSNYRIIIYDPYVGLVEESIRELRLTVKALTVSNDIKDSPILDWIERA
jgi:hypothetical protein